MWLPSDRIYWPNVLVHTAVRAVILWPLVRFVGGVSGVRGVATAVLASGACTATRVLYERSTLPKLPLYGPGLDALPRAQQHVVYGTVVDTTGEAA